MGATVGGAPGNGASAGEGAVADDDRSLFVPAGLPNGTIDDEDTALTLLAFTLVQGSAGPELYVAARNDGDSPVCEPGVMTNFYDTSGALVASVGSTLLAAQFHALGDGTVLPCVDPGEIGMSGNTELPATIVIGELGYLEHSFPAFVLNDLGAAAGLQMSGVKAVHTVDGTAYAGLFQNGLTVAATQAVATVFPVNRVGRPLGKATADAPDDIPPGYSWEFQTSAVEDAGTGEYAFPGGNGLQ